DEGASRILQNCRYAWVHSRERLGPFAATENMRLGRICVLVVHRPDFRQGYSLSFLRLLLLLQRRTLGCEFWELGGDRFSGCFRELLIFRDQSLLRRRPFGLFRR